MGCQFCRQNGALSASWDGFVTDPLACRYACLKGLRAPLTEKLVNGWPAARIGELLPWAYAKQAIAPEIKIAA